LTQGEEDVVRAIGLDVHLNFCEVAIVVAGSLAADDRVALEVTGNAWEIARISRAACRAGDRGRP
jgi:hypothetical protein